MFNKYSKLLFMVCLVTPTCSYNPGQSLGILHFCQHIFFLSTSASPPPTQGDVNSSKVDPLFLGSGGRGFWQIKS